MLSRHASITKKNIEILTNRLRVPFMESPQIYLKIQLTDKSFQALGRTDFGIPDQHNLRSSAGS